MLNKQEIQTLHIFNDPKFSKPFFKFLIRNNVNLDNDFLFHYRCKNSTCEKFGMQTIFAAHFFSPIANLLMLKPLFQSKKIIIHGLASPFLLLYLSLFPRLGRKSYWVIWGKDLYFYKTLKKKHFYHDIYEFFRKKAIKNISHIISYSQGDYELAKKWYGTIAKWHKSFAYPSNLYKPTPETNKDSAESIVILVGNSADPSNNHAEAFTLLDKYKDRDIEVIAPLSYGNKNYRNQTIELGKRIFGKKFNAINTLLPENEYNRLLSRVDIGIFAHKRQQAMSNITTLLGMGKKVYIRKEITTYKLLSELGVQTFDLHNFNLEPLDQEVKKKNKTIIAMEFSEANLLTQWRKIEAEGIQ